MAGPKRPAGPEAGPSWAAGVGSYSPKRWAGPIASAARRPFPGLSGTGKWMPTSGFWRSSIDALEPHVDLELFSRVLAAELEARGLPHGTLGRGVFAGTVRELVGARLQLLVVLGMGEGICPPRGQDDPVLPEHHRSRAAAALPPRRPSRIAELRDLAAAVAGADCWVCSFARADTRSHRERMPARWLLAEIGRLAGRSSDKPVAASELDRIDEPWFLDLPSFEWWPSHLDVAASATDAFLSWTAKQPRGAPAVPAGDRRLRRGFEAVLARRHGVFDEWLGHIGTRPELRFDDLRVGSATAFEDWATCPFRYFLRRVLDVRALDERAEADSISNLDRGSLTHEVLERYVRHELDHQREPAAGVDLDRLRGLAARVGEEFRDRGRTGRPLLWALESDKLLRRLERVLALDRDYRRARGVEPVAVELAFGTGDDGAVPPVVITLGSGRSVAFRGKIDRVDRSADGDRLVVIDYKTGKAGPSYEELRATRDTGAPLDIVCRGRHLQLAIYALAARTAYGDLPVSAFFWFVDQPGDRSFVGGDIDAYAQDRLREVLEVIVEGIEHGWFPARPGDDDYLFGFTNCGFCDFDRVCPNRRAEQWEAVRMAPPLTRYRELAEGSLE